MKNKERQRLLKIYGSLYQRHYIEDHNKCFYCGFPRDTLDHSPPLAWIEAYSTSFLRESKIPFVLIPCCTECNNLLGDKRLLTTEERAEYLKTKYSTLFSKLVKWTDEELEEMGEAFQRSIKAKQRREHDLRDKHKAVSERLEKPWTFPDMGQALIVDCRGF